MDDWKSILAERLEIPEFKDKEVQKDKGTTTPSN